MREIIMGYQGEMSLKGLNRNQFESAMMKILRYRLKTVGKFKVYCTQSTFIWSPRKKTWTWIWPLTGCAPCLVWRR